MPKVQQQLNLLNIEVSTRMGTYIKHFGGNVMTFPCPDHDASWVDVWEKITLFTTKDFTRLKNAYNTAEQKGKMLLCRMVIIQIILYNLSAIPQNTTWINIQI